MTCTDCGDPAHEYATQRSAQPTCGRCHVQNIINRAEIVSGAASGILDAIRIAIDVLAPLADNDAPNPTAIQLERAGILGEVLRSECVDSDARTSALWMAIEYLEKATANEPRPAFPGSGTSRGSGGSLPALRLVRSVDE